MAASLPFISLSEALARVRDTVIPLTPRPAPLSACCGKTAAETVRAKTAAPAADVSMKDGYALTAEDTAGLSQLPIVGLIGAGQKDAPHLQPGTCIRILTGARIPEGADAVIAEEFASVTAAAIVPKEAVRPGRNILKAGADIRAGDVIINAGHRLTPGLVGLLAAGGHSQVVVYPSPQVALIATGDEIVLPGRPLPRGSVYASNLMTLNAWCAWRGFAATTDIVPDDAAALTQRLRQAASVSDAVITSGGAWTGDRDMMVRVLEHLGWEKVFHRVRLGPGKAVGFGRLYGKPVFILPGGPPSNLVAFLLIALPALVRLSGTGTPAPLPQTHAVLTAPVTGMTEWTQAIFAAITREGNRQTVAPLSGPSRLQTMATANGLFILPEGSSRFEAGEIIPVLRLDGDL